MSRIKEEQIQKIIELHKKGYRKVDIAKETGVSLVTINKQLDKYGINSRGYIDRLSVEQHKEVCKLYLENNWDEIFGKYPYLTKAVVYKIASMYGVKKESYFWSKEDTEFLIHNYNVIDSEEIAHRLNYRHTAGAIRVKARKMNLAKDPYWSDEEKDILIKNYSSVSKSEILKLLPKRTHASIICMAMKLNIKSKEYLDANYSDEQKAFIIENSSKMTDAEMANILNKPLSGVQEQRRILGIYYLNKDYSKYENLAKLFRSKIHYWKVETMEKDEYKCVLTGSHEFDIHHIYGFNKIVAEALNIADSQGKLKSCDVSDYSEQELNELIDIFQKVHSSYPLGVCIKKEIHKLFHKIYGAGGNTEWQWNQFVNDYKNNKYSDYLIA